MYIRRDQDNLLVYGPDRPCSKQKLKIKLQNFDQLNFSIFFCCLKKKKEIEHNKFR